MLSLRLDIYLLCVDLETEAIIHIDILSVAIVTSFTKTPVSTRFIYLHSDMTFGRGGTLESLIDQVCSNMISMPSKP